MFLLKKYYFFNSTQKILLTGIQPTGSLHIGNYLGSVANILKYQKAKQYDKIFLMIADYHSLTTGLNYDHGVIKYNNRIREDTLEMAKVLIASGVDSKQICFFVQSQVPSHLELAWIFNCISPQHWLNKMIQFKEKGHQNSSVGLYTYPILMASDILLYRATHIPVGLDQVQHLELTASIAERFNQLFATNYFPRPNYLEAKLPKVMSLSDPNKKMSKSDSIERSRINLSDGQKEIREKIRRAVTDKEGDRLSYEPQKRQGLANLLELYSCLKDHSVEESLAYLQRQGLNIGKFKDLLATQIVNSFASIQQNMRNITDEQVKATLTQSARVANETAQGNLTQIKRLLNIYQ